MEFYKVCPALMAGKKIKQSNWKNDYWQKKDRTVLHHFEQGMEAPIRELPSTLLAILLMSDNWEIVGEKITKLFISQPMKGKSDEEILAVRDQAIREAKKVIGGEVEVIDSFFQNAPADAKPLWYLGESLKLLATADVAYFAEGWDEARGCKIEHECAVEYGIDRIEM